MNEKAAESIWRFFHKNEDKEEEHEGQYSSAVKDVGGDEAEESHA
jgi:hypothetical protein